MTQPIRPSSVRVVAVVMADGSDPYAPRTSPAFTARC